jgi:hypothetical protein
VIMNDRPAGQKGWKSTALGVDAVMCVERQPP